MKEIRVNIDGDNIYVLMSKQKSKLDSIVCIHGIGESHMSFSEAFQKLDDFNVFAIDLPGFGRTKPSSTGDYSTVAQAKRALQIISKLGLTNITLIGHSWGGDVGTYMCDLDVSGDKLIKRFINVEGAIHTENVIMSKKVSKKFSKFKKTPKKFEDWLIGNGFAKKFVMKWGIAAGIRYLASVRLCSPKIFGRTATEIIEQNKTKDEEGVIDLGRLYANLKIPTVYCWGTDSLKGEDYLSIKKFLKTLDNKLFIGASHWVMIDAKDEFYGFVQSFIYEKK